MWRTFLLFFWGGGVFVFLCDVTSGCLNAVIHASHIFCHIYVFFVYFPSRWHIGLWHAFHASSKVNFWSDWTRFPSQQSAGLSSVRSKLPIGPSMFVRTHFLAFCVFVFTRWIVVIASNNPMTEDNMDNSKHMYANNLDMRVDYTWRNMRYWPKMAGYWPSYFKKRRPTSSRLHPNIFLIVSGTVHFLWGREALVGFDG